MADNPSLPPVDEIVRVLRIVAYEYANKDTEPAITPTIVEMCREDYAPTLRTLAHALPGLLRDADRWRFFRAQTFNAEAFDSFTDSYMATVHPEADSNG